MDRKTDRQTDRQISRLTNWLNSSLVYSLPRNSSQCWCGQPGQWWGVWGRWRRGRTRWRRQTSPSPAAVARAHWRRPPGSIRDHQKTVDMDKHTYWWQLNIPICWGVMSYCCAEQQQTWKWKYPCDQLHSWGVNSKNHFQKIRCTTNRRNVHKVCVRSARGL